MSRVLSNLLGAAEPAFRLRLRQLEQAAGQPSTDIRLATQTILRARHKVAELGLDSTNTTGPELYAALQSRLRSDEAQLRRSLNVAADSPADVMAAVQHLLEGLEIPRDVLAVKPAVLRQIIKKLKPKATLKGLGYRSMDSMLKHESPARLLAAAQLCESPQWHAARLEAYGQLSSHDFEVRPLAFVLPEGKQWPKLTVRYSDHHRHSLLLLQEAGAVVLLPPRHDMEGLAILTTVLGLQALNEARSCSAYLKLHQVRPDFACLFQEALKAEPMTQAMLGGQPLPWRVVHWFYAGGYAAFHPEVFEPHVQPDDLTLSTLGGTLADVLPVLEFWRGNEAVGFLDGNDTVSLHVLDVALGVCNGLGYAERVLTNMRSVLSHELFARYLHQDNLQSALVSSLDAQLTPATEFDT